MQLIQTQIFKNNQEFSDWQMASHRLITQIQPLYTGLSVSEQQYPHHYSSSSDVVVDSYALFVVYIIEAPEAEELSIKAIERALGISGVISFTVVDNLVYYSFTESPIVDLTDAYVINLYELKAKL